MRRLSAQSAQVEERVYMYFSFVWFVYVAMSTVLCQKGLSDIFCHFVLFRDYDTTADNTSPIKFLEASCAWK